MRQILTVNAGGTSLKIGIFDWETEEQLADEYMDWSQEGRQGINNHSDAFDFILNNLDLTSIYAVGHRIVHGGNEFRHAVKIAPAVIETLTELCVIAPLHNPIALKLIDKAQKRFPEIPHVATFDTSFHNTLPMNAYMLPLPYKWYEEWDIRRFGFHGLNLTYCVEQAAYMLDKAIHKTNLIICHLGSGCSITAVKNGQSVATTMSYTPLAGIMMASRSGSIDPGLLFFLLKHKNISVSQLEKILNEQSGLKGLSEITSDLRDILPAMKGGDEKAKIAYEVYIHSIREGIGQMIMSTGGIDALVFTDGVGENSAEVRSNVTASLDWLGISLNDGRNVNTDVDRDIATQDSKIRILVIHNREELIIQRETRELLI